MSLHVHTIKPPRGSKHRRKLLGRGNASGHGNYSTRGGKGQTARSGGSRGLKLKGFKHLMQQTPKLRGFHSQSPKPEEVYLRDLRERYSDGETVTLASLKQKGLIRWSAKAAKVINTGELGKKLILDGVLYSSGAAEKIKAAGGEVK